MSSRLAATVLVAALIGLIAGSALLFRLRVGTGDVFPEYSSLRADPLGTQALHDSLQALPSVVVNRNLEPLDRLPADPARTILITGVHRSWWTDMAADDVGALELAVRGGSRLVIAMRARGAVGDDDEAAERNSGNEGSEQKPASRRDAADEKRRVQLWDQEHIDLAKRWGVAIEYHLMPDGDSAARRADQAPASLPEFLPWASEIHFVPATGSGWSTVYWRGQRQVVIERKLGRGSIVVCGDAYVFSNEALQRDRATAFLVWMIGSHRHVTFDETHLGVRSDPGIAALARRYGLGGAFFTLLILAALFAWQRAAVFVPANAAPDEVRLTYEPTAGLESLLRRSVAPADLMRVAGEEWRRTANEHERRKLDTALHGATGHPPVAQYNAMVKALRRN